MVSNYKQVSRERGNSRGRQVSLLTAKAARRAFGVPPFPAPVWPFRSNSPTTPRKEVSQHWLPRSSTSTQRRSRRRRVRLLSRHSSSAARTCSRCATPTSRRSAKTARADNEPLSTDVYASSVGQGVKKHYSCPSHIRQKQSFVSNVRRSHRISCMI